MKCPFCAHIDDKVIDSREGRGGDTIRRRRECLKCGRRFTTLRFASVYMDFKDVQEFMSELKNLLKDRVKK